MIGVNYPLERKLLVKKKAKINGGRGRGGECNVVNFVIDKT